jgi:hypothetical protein
VTAVKPGVHRRSKRAGEVPFTPTPITVMRPVRDRGQFIVDAVVDGFTEAEDRKHLANRLKSR